jgi:hypothetical protein
MCAMCDRLCKTETDTADRDREVGIGRAAAGKGSWGWSWLFACLSRRRQEGKKGPWGWGRAGHRVGRALCSGLCQGQAGCGRKPSLTGYADFLQGHLGKRREKPDTAPA